MMGCVPYDTTRAVDVGHWLMNVLVLFVEWRPLIAVALSCEQIFMHY
jgi:hypothetical protein